MDNKQFFNTFEIVEENFRPAVSLMLDTEKDFDAMKRFYNYVPDFFHSSWRYHDLVKLILSDVGQCFGEHNRDVGLDIRETTDVSFKFEHL